MSRKNGTFGNIIPCPFCELTTRTSKFSMEEDWQLVSLYLYGMHLHNLKHKHKKHTLLMQIKKEINIKNAFQKFKTENICRNLKDSLHKMTNHKKQKESKYPNNKQ